MSHYELNQWQEYKKQALPLSTAGMMEKHLRSCNQCVLDFLSTISENDIILAGRMISKGFVDSVMKNICLERQLSIIPKAGKQVRKKNMVGGYLAAAILAIFLMHFGVFNSFVFQAPQLVSETVEQKLDEPGWAGRMLDSYLDWIIDKSIGNKRSEKNNE